MIIIKDDFITRHLIRVRIAIWSPTIIRIPIPYTCTISLKQNTLAIHFRNILINLNKIFILRIIISPTGNVC